MDLTLKPRQAVEEIENWDDDDLDIGGDDFTFRSASVATTGTNAPSHHRDSISSRLSMRSDFDSNHGDEERLVHLPGNDERSTNDAIAAATRAGIPIPQNVPPSALMGGTIKRLGGRKIKKIIQQDDWNDDLELPGPGQGLKIKQQDESNFPDALRQVSGPGSTHQSPSKPLQAAPVFGLSPRRTLKSKSGSANLSLDRLRDNDDDDLFGDGGATIRVSKNRVPEPVTLIMPPTPQKNAEIADEDFEAGLELPADGEPLRLSARKDIPKTPISAQDEFDEWGEGSLGTRFGGTRRDGRSNRSSSASALSPSVASSLTAESEYEVLYGLVLPSGPLNFEDILKKRQQTLSPEHRPEDRCEQQQPEEKQRAEKQSGETLSPKHAAFKDDFLSELEIPDGDVFNSSRLTVNQNIKIKSGRSKSPSRPKAAISLTFTNKPSPVNSRLPRPPGHDRLPSSLEPVSETGGPIQNRQRRAQSRLGGHSAQSSITSIPTPATPSSTHSLLPSTPRRHELTKKTSTNGLRNEPTTTNAQLLKLKRSMPTMRTSTQSPAKPMGSRYDRPPSRTEGNRPPAMSRPKTPVERDRSGAESSMSHARRNPMPFLPAGASQSQSHHVTVKASRNFRRHDSESSNHSADNCPTSRAVSRSTMRSPSPVRSRLRGAEALAREAAAKRQITKPRIPRHFGDGFELDGFDDLPTSQLVEQKYIKQPVGRGVPKSLLRNKIIQNVAPDRTTTPTPTTPYSPARHEYLPRFARDTTASRMAREQALAQRAPSSGAPHTTLTNQWKAQITAKTGLSAVPTQIVRVKKGRQPVQQKPHLIKPLGDMSSNPKCKSLCINILQSKTDIQSAVVKGMVYNPVTFRWEGNENDLSPFDAPSNSPSVASMPPNIFREKENTTPRPALITNIKSSQAVQVVGGMVFDPQAMRWLKLPKQTHMRPLHGASVTSGSDTMDGFDALDDDDDVFKDVPDLVDRPKSPSKEDFDNVNDGEKGSDSAERGGLKDDWLVGEEFDVGPEFVRRQREEEERWRRKCEKWLGPERDALDVGDWRWCIRDVVNEL
jgi:hypothetical protein